jgi:hypothetical protein
MSKNELRRFDAAGVRGFLLGVLDAVNAVIADSFLFFQMARGWLQKALQFSHFIFKIMHLRQTDG